ncbi:DinB family protein [Paenibacillus sp. HB172176]|uniref:DinB family protein n=1 Tax=Paenibacillus sp. HB172176 TaxID=2493690 RepID=UPI00143892BD|nr:DinB family protein [Paenibacillus sp. HB172176]
MGKLYEFWKLREETIAFLEALGEDQLDAVAPITGESLRWLVGNLLVRWDHSFFPKLGFSWRLPDYYHTMFPNGTMQNQWNASPPSKEELLRQLRSQREQISEDAEGHLEYPVLEPFHDMHTINEVFIYMIEAERQQLEVMKQSISFEGTERSD